ncbi:MAG: nucleotidyltransferase substrate binding protein [Clostridium sp.]
MDALADRNLTTHTYDEELANKMTEEIVNIYLPELDKIYVKLLKEI